MDYVIIGAGPAGVVAAEALRKADPAGSVTIIGGEAEAPYSRMAIPYLLAENVGEEGTHLRHGDGHYEAGGITLRQGRVTSISPGDKTVALDGGDSVAFDKLLIATGAHPVKPPIDGMDLAGIENCWTLDDSRRIAAGTKKGSRVVLMGAGFIGCIILEALVKRGVELTVIEMEDRMLPRMMDETGGDMIERWVEAKGVAVRTGTRVEKIEAVDGGLRLALSGGDAIDAEFVVCATGVAPNLGFLDGSGIETGDGILVDEHLETSVPGIYAAGDVAQGPTSRPAAAKSTRSSRPLPNTVALPPGTWPVAPRAIAARCR
jgi:NADPH-dependent 2,4-dienoyl-CoA reductase/sulfur reductase-like enzyme